MRFETARAKAREYVATFRGIQENLWFKVVIWVWTFAAIYDLALSQFVPEEYAKKAPKVWESAVIAGGLFPWWGWLLMLSAILVIGSFEYAGRIRRGYIPQAQTPTLKERAATNRKAMGSLPLSAGTLKALGIEVAEPSEPQYGAPKDKKDFPIGSISFVELGDMMIQRAAAIRKSLIHAQYNATNAEIVNGFLANHAGEVFWLYTEAEKRGLHNDHLEIVRNHPDKLDNKDSIKYIASELEKFGHVVKLYVH